MVAGAEGDNRPYRHMGSWQTARKEIGRACSARPRGPAIRFARITEPIQARAVVVLSCGNFLYRGTDSSPENRILAIWVVGVQHGIMPLRLMNHNVGLHPDVADRLTVWRIEFCRGQSQTGTAMGKRKNSLNRSFAITSPSDQGRTLMIVNGCRKDFACTGTVFVD